MTAHTHAFPLGYIKSRGGEMNRKMSKQVQRAAVKPPLSSVTSPKKNSSHNLPTLFQVVPGIHYGQSIHRLSILFYYALLKSTSKLKLPRKFLIIL